MFGLKTYAYKRIRAGILRAHETRTRTVPSPLHQDKHFRRAHDRIRARYWPSEPLSQWSKRGSVAGASEELKNRPAIIRVTNQSLSRTTQALEYMQIETGSDQDRALAYLTYTGITLRIAMVFSRIIDHGKIQPEDIEALRDAGINTDAIEGWYGWPT